MRTKSIISLGLLAYIAISVVVAFLFFLAGMGAEFYRDQIKPLFFPSTATAVPTFVSSPIPPTKVKTPTPVLPEVVEDVFSYESLTFTLFKVSTHSGITSEDYYYTPLNDDQIVDIAFNVHNSSSEKVMKIEDMGISFTATGQEAYFANFYGFEQGKKNDPAYISIGEAGKGGIVRFYSSTTTLRLVFFVSKSTPYLYFQIQDSPLMRIANPK